MCVDLACVATHLPVTRGQGVTSSNHTIEHRMPKPTIKFGIAYSYNVELVNNNNNNNNKHFT